MNKKKEQVGIYSGGAGRGFRGWKITNRNQQWSGGGEWILVNQNRTLTEGKQGDQVPKMGDEGCGQLSR